MQGFGDTLSVANLAEFLVYADNLQDRANLRFVCDTHLLIAWWRAIIFLMMITE